MGVAKKIQRRKNSSLRVLEVFEMFRIEKKALGIEGTTIRNYQESLTKFLRFLECEDMELHKLEKMDILEFIGEMQEQGLKVATINHYLRDLRAFFNWCSAADYMEPLSIKLVKGQESVKETYSEDELTLLLKKPQKDFYCEWRTWAIIHWILATGNREKTVCDIQMQDINMKEKEIVLRHTKNKKIQIIPMSTELANILCQFIRDFRSEALPEEYLFCNVAGERLSENALKLSVREYNLSRGVTKTSVHALRHTFAKYWIRNSGDAFRLQKMLGHSTLDMTRNYVNMFSADLKEGFDEFSPLDKLKRSKGVRHTIKRRG